MINDATLQVNLTLNDQLTAKMNASFASIKGAVDKATTSLHNLGSQLVQAGRNATFIGAAIAGPLALAFKTTTDYSIQAGESLKNLSAQTVELQKTVGTALVPVMDKLASNIKSVTDWFKSLDPHVRNTIIQGAWLTAEYLILGGTALKLVGDLAKLTSGFIKLLKSQWELIAIAAIVGLIIYKWEDFKNIVLPIIDAIIVHVNALTMSVGLAIKALYYLTTLSPLNLIPAFAQARKEAKEFADELSKISFTNIIDTLSGKKDSSLNSAVENFRNFIANIKKMIGGLGGSEGGGNDPMLSFRLNFEKQFKQAYDSAVNIGANSAKILIGQINQLSQGIGDALGKSIVEGKNFGESMKQTFKDMAESFISDVASMIVQWLAFMALKEASSFLGFGLFHSGGQVMHEGGPIRAHSGLAVDEVPIIAQTGEGILSRRGMSALGGAGTLNALNSGRSGGSGGVSVIINGNVSAQPGDVEELALRISRLWNERQRSRVR